MAFTFPSPSKRSPQRLEMFEQMAKRIPTHDAAITMAVQQLVAGYKAVTDQHSRLSRDETLTPGAKLVKLAKAARTNVGASLERLDAAFNTAGQRKAHLRGEIEKAYNVPGKSYEAVMRHQEIRAMFRRMSQTEALKALEEARESNDLDTLHAVCEYQSYLSGIPLQMHAHTRTVLTEANAPEEAQALAAIEQQEELVQIFRNEMAQSIADLVDFHRADEIMAAAQLDAAE